jgi:enhancer of mRNA-decapping protein 4
MLSFSFGLFQETINSASSITQGLTSELLDGQRKLLALVASGNPISHNTSVLQPTNGPLPNLPEVLNAKLNHLHPVGSTRLLYVRLL